jgi:hypothetical protein
MTTLASLLKEKVPSGASPLAGLSRQPRVEGKLIWQQDPPEAWIRAIRTVSEKSDVHGWLYLHWMPGEEWVPCQRWGIYEMLHPRWVPFDLMEEFDGPHPRTEGHYCSNKVPKQFQCLCKRKLEAWRGGPCSFITAEQWTIYRKTGYVPRHLFWVIQGKGGGHKAFFTDQEEDWLTAAGMSLRIPYPGEIPYAPFDARVLSHIMKHNALKKYGDDLMKYRRAMGPEHAAELQKRLKEFRESVLSWFDQQMKEECELFVEAADNGEMDNLPKSDIDYERLMDASIPHYIETGQVLHPSQLDRPTVVTD